MTTDIVANSLGDIRIAGAAGGVACTTTAAFTSFHKGTNWISLTPRNFDAGATVCRILLSPYLTILKTTDLLVALTNMTDYSKNAQDANSATLVTLSSLNTLANGDCLYVGSHVPFRGVYMTGTAYNTNASILTVKYWQDAATDAWTTTSATDGTIAPAGTSLGQSGLVYWTVPTDWKCASLKDIGDTVLPVGGPLNDKLYWTRWEWSAALDSTTTFNQMVAANSSTAYAELVESQVLEQRIHNDTGGIGGVESLTNAGTGNLVVNCATLSTGNKFS